MTSAIIEAKVEKAIMDLWRVSGSQGVFKRLPKVVALMFEEYQEELGIIGDDVEEGETVTLPPSIETFLDSLERGRNA